MPVLICRQCDEEKPCSNCVRFDLPCNLVSDNTHLQYASPSTTTRRGRGRPRKTWTAVLSDRPSALVAAGDGSSPLASTILDVTVDPTPINVDHAELLLHFVSTTAGTLGGHECPRMLRFWMHNVPHIGLSRSFVLHFVLALAAFHLAYLSNQEIGVDEKDVDTHHAVMRPRRRRAEYLAVAQEHLTAGVSGFTSQLSRPSPDNCGALYLGATMISYCTFADGPSSREDLLVCTGIRRGDGACESEDAGMMSDDNGVSSPAAASSSSSPGAWMPFVSGVRLISETFGSDVLFAGPLKPLVSGPPPILEGPVYARDGFPRLDWEEALDGLRGFIVGVVASDGDTSTSRDTSPTHDPSLEALDKLIGIYQAIYGRRSPDGEIKCDGPPQNQFVFGWLYCLELEFARYVRRHDPCALLVLAHFAVLLEQNTVQGGWYVEGWREHIIARVGEVLADSHFSEWMHWPMEQVAHKRERDGRPSHRHQG